jgi:hypothetical protein
MLESSNLLLICQADNRFLTIIPFENLNEDRRSNSIRHFQCGHYGDSSKFDLLNDQYYNVVNAFYMFTRGQMIPLVKETYAKVATYCKPSVYNSSITVLHARDWLML